MGKRVRAACAVLAFMLAALALAWWSLFALSRAASAARAREGPALACPRTDVELDGRGCPVGFWLFEVEGDQVVNACAEIRARCGLP